MCSLLMMNWLWRIKIMKIFIRAIFVSVIFLNFTCLTSGQEKQTKQQQVLQKIEQEKQIKEVREKEIEKQLGLNKENKTTSEFFWEKGIGLTTKNIAQKRDTSQYIWGGHIDCRGWAIKDELSFECDKTKVGDFIWQNWTNKKRGYITISGDSVDALSTMHIFIEPNKSGEWTIIERFARFQAVSRDSPYYIDDYPNIISVTRIERKNNISEWSYVFKDKSGKTSHPISNFLD